jgi:DNA-binding LacI/PurR family transcriptional regulator
MSSIHDVAKEAGVSTATVSRTFNTPGLLSESTHKRVLEAAKRLNYLPNRTRIQNRIRLSRGDAGAQALNQPGTKEAFIGFQFFSYSPIDTLVSNAFYAPIMAGAQFEASNLGMHLLLHTTDRHAMEMELPKMVRDRTVAGMLLVGTADPQVLTTFLEHVPEIVLVDNRDSTGKHDCIVSDGFAGTVEATRYLMDLGHKRIGFITDDSTVPTFQDRLHGFICAHFDAGRILDPGLIVRTEPGEDLIRVAADFLARPDRPTAVVTSNDMAASHVLQACRELDIHVPNELSVIGFDDIDLSSQLWPPLTTVRVNKELMGRLGVSRLQARLQARDSSPDAMPPVTIEVPVSLIVRQSCRSLSL